MADLLDLDPTRITRWLFTRCVQESLDEPALLPIAATLARI
jgi:streptomycin 6-kinase